MRFLDATEFAESLRLQGNEFADELLEALDLRDDIEPVYLEMTEELGDRTGELNRVREKLAENGFDDPNRDVDDLVSEVADDLALAHRMLRKRGLWTEGDFYDALSTALDRVPQFDL